METTVRMEKKKICSNALGQWGWDCFCLLTGACQLPQAPEVPRFPVFVPSTPTGSLRYKTLEGCNWRQRSQRNEELPPGFPPVSRGPFIPESCCLCSWVSLLASMTIHTRGTANS